MASVFHFPGSGTWPPESGEGGDNETNPVTGMFPGVRIGMRTHRGTCASGNLFESTGKLKSCLVFGGEPGISHRTY